MFAALTSLAMLAALTGLLVAPVMVALEYLLEVKLNLPERPVGLFLGIFVLPFMAIGTSLGLVRLLELLG